MNSISIYEYRDPVEFLGSVLRERKTRNPRYSIRAWARQLGYGNPAFLAQVLKGQRKLHLGLARKLSDNLSLAGEPRRYFELLVLNHSARSEGERETYAEWMSNAAPQNAPAQISLETFRLIADWYHLALAELTSTRGASSDPETLRRRLGDRVSTLEIERALERMVKLGILDQTQRGSKKVYRKGKLGDLQAGQGIPSEAIRRHHRQMIALGLEALENQTLQERHFSASTLSVRLKDLAKLRKILEEAHQKILALSVSADGDEVYQVNTQLFRLSEPPRTKGKTV